MNTYKRRNTNKQAEGNQHPNFTVCMSFIDIFAVDTIPTPCLYGLRHPAIYIPSFLLDEQDPRHVSPNELRHIIAHESVHYQHKDYIWSNKDIDPHEIRSKRESILNHFALGESVIDKRRRLGRILDIPYFGRIDFKEKKNGANILPIYIGIHTFYDSQNKMNLIYDWRAPISSMFYDYELGEAT